MPMTSPGPTGRPRGSVDGIEAPLIVSNAPGSFAWGVIHQRHPKLIQQVRDGLPYGPRECRGLDRLLEEISEGTIRPLEVGTHDRERWEAWSREYIGQRWADVPFLWAESFFYRKLLDAVGYFAPGPWSGIDPFEPAKSAELVDDLVDGELASLDRLSSLPGDERRSAFLAASLWGNRADLGFVLSQAADVTPDQTGDLVADDSALLWSILDKAAPARLCLVADNAGRELLADLVLIDDLLAGGQADRVMLHVKPAPYYVSDATTADVLACLRRLARSTGHGAATSTRLWEAMTAGRLALATHPFYCAPLPYPDMPADLAEHYAAASLTIMKGDLNYRRLVDDRAWPATTPFADLTAYFPGPVAALRTLKSDVAVGLGPEAVTRLDRTGGPWRTDGTHALVQARS